MNEVVPHDPNTGELISSTVASMDAADMPLAVRLAKVELDQAISTAKAYPRSLTRVRDNVSALVMLDEETAKECIYALPRGGKPIKGPSVRFAEIVASQYGNCKVGSRVVDVNKFEKYVEAEGVFIDLESGMQRTARIRRKISDKNGRVYNDDMIVMTGNAACAIALREAILKGVPKALWRKAYDDAEGVIAGDIKTLAERREGAIKAFAAWGITPDQIFSSLEIGGIDEIGLDQIATLTAMFKAIKTGEQTVEDYFPAKAKAADGVEAAKGTAGKLEGIAKGKAADKEEQKDADHKAAEANRADDAARQKMQDERDAKSKAQEQHGSDAGDALAEGDAKAETEGGDDGKADKTAGTSADDKPAEKEKVQETAGAKDGSETTEPSKRAYDRGRKAHGRGMRQDAIPSDIKDEAQRDEWVAGWKDASEEAGG
jgi:ribosome modulation factor